MNRKTCECGILSEYAEDYSFPLIKEGNEYAFVFSDEEQVNIQFCFFCGGYKLGSATTEVYECDCKVLDEWSKDVKIPIKFDEKFNEFYFEGKDGSTTVFYFCPLCGGKLPESKRGDGFLIPSNAEMNEFNKKIENAKTIDKVVLILGVPDDKIITDSEEIKKQKLIGQNYLKQTLIYNSISDTSFIVVAEDQDGKILSFFSGKPKIK